jgi:hypothetical protein
MFRTGLDFAPGTTDACKKLVGSLFTPTELLSAYRAARQNFATGDLVLTVSEKDPSGFEATPRIAYVKTAKNLRGKKGLPMLMRGLEQSAHAIVSLPFESEAMWLIVNRGLQQVPVMCVLFATQFEVSEAATA